MKKTNIYITKKYHRGFSKKMYLANWLNNDGYVFYDWFSTLKELKDYFCSWENVTFIQTNF